MCGRIVQKSAAIDYVETIWPKSRLSFSDPAGPRFNVSPGTRPLTLHMLVDAEGAIARLPWGYKRAGSKHFMINAKLETILKNGWPWRFLFNGGRIVVPADGWYEWPALPDGTKQPHYIHPRDGAPLMLVALTAWRHGAALDAEHGFAIVTNDTRGGMIDIHDRRPVALSPEDDRLWLDPTTPTADARELLQKGIAESAFTWHAVRQEVGNTEYQLPDAIAPM